MELKNHICIKISLQFHTVGYDKHRHTFIESRWLIFHTVKILLNSGCRAQIFLFAIAEDKGMGLFVKQRKTFMRALRIIKLNTNPDSLVTFH